MKVKEAVVARTNELCEKEKIAKNELANRSGLTPSTVYSLFDPTRKQVNITTIKKLCDGLNLSLSEFFDSDLFRNLEQEIE